MPWFATLRLLSLFAAALGCYLLGRALIFEANALRLPGEVIRESLRQGDPIYTIRFEAPILAPASKKPAVRSDAKRAGMTHEIETPPSRWIRLATGQKVIVLYSHKSGDSELDHPYIRFGPAGLSSLIALFLVLLSHRARNRYEALVARRAIAAPRNL